MVAVLSFKEYTISYVTVGDEELLQSVLEKAVVVGGNASMRARGLRKLQAHCRKAVAENTAVLVSKDGVVVGAAIFYDRRINEIIHINILKEYRLQLATIVLLDYLLNTIFNSQDVYFYSEDSEIQRFGTNVKGDTYKVLSTIASLFRYRMEK